MFFVTRRIGGICVGKDDSEKLLRDISGWLWRSFVGGDDMLCEFDQVGEGVLSLRAHHGVASQLFKGKAAAS